MESTQVKEMVRRRYGQFARAGSGCGCGCGCSTAKSQAPAAETIGERIGYTKEDLAAVPDGANLGLGCGNPVGLASIKEGDTVLDLGSGAGFDCFLASRKTGPGGRVIGVDMTPEMLERARANAQRGGYDNVEFRQGEIERLPVEDNSVDVIISNCVINLAADKDRVLAEAFRVLKPRGRFAVSDVVVRGELPPEVRRSMELWAGCVAGALSEDDYRAKLARAGFRDIDLEVTRVYSLEDAQGLLGCCSADTDAIAQETEGKLVSAFVRARKP